MSIEALRRGLRAHYATQGCHDESEYLLRLRGLDAAKRYRVTWDTSGQTCELDGAVLAQQGITVRLEGALTSELLRFEESGG